MTLRPPTAIDGEKRFRNPGLVLRGRYYHPSEVRQSSLPGLRSDLSRFLNGESEPTLVNRWEPGSRQRHLGNRLFPNHQL